MQLLKVFCIIVALFLIVDVSMIGIWTQDKGVYNGTEQEFMVLLTTYTVKGCPDDASNSTPWLSGPQHDIFDVSFVELMFYDYRFLFGKYIPRKYSHLIREKLKAGCK